MQIEFDNVKRNATLAARGLDFARCDAVFDGPTLTQRDERVDYGEERFITLGLLDALWVVLVWTPRGANRRIISMRFANEHEIKRYASSVV
ncbi:MAG: BrnT family toxin [Polaromonas sp.]|nr:BrnT family toxin [Polaromonas sp.]